MKVIFKSIILLLFFFVTTGCSSDTNIAVAKKDIYLKDLKKADLQGAQCTGVKVLEVYLNEEPCVGKNINANLYKCENIENGDTLYVFDTCNKVPYFVKADFGENLCVMDENVKNIIPDTVSLRVPKLFSIPANSKYIFSSLTRLID